MVPLDDFLIYFLNITLDLLFLNVDHWHHSLYIFGYLEIKLHIVHPLRVEETIGTISR